MNKSLNSVRKVSARPAIRINEVIKSNPIRYFLKVTWDSDHLIKSLSAVYMPANTPKRERIIVKTGVDNPRTLSSLIPHHVITRIMTIIWNARPEYLPKSLNPLFSWFFGDFFWFFGFCESCCFIIFTFTHFAIPGKFCSWLN